MKFHAWKRYVAKPADCVRVYTAFCGVEKTNCSETFFYDKDAFMQHYAKDLQCKTCLKQIKTLDQLAKSIPCSKRIGHA